MKKPKVDEELSKKYIITCFGEYATSCDANDEVIDALKHYLKITKEVEVFENGKKLPLYLFDLDQ